MGHAFAAARPAAVHCPELTERGPRPEERAALLAVWRRDLARLLADDLSPLLSGDRLIVTIAEPETVTGADALQRIGPVAANSLLRCGASEETALLSFDFATALALTDRSFGGDGMMCPSAAEVLPRSAALLVEEAATVIAGAITRASYGDAPIPAGASLRGPNGGEVIVRSESAARLKPFSADAEVMIFGLSIANRQGAQWRASLALAGERLVRLLPGAGRQSRPAAPRHPASGMAAPFDAMPLPLHVVLAEFDLSLARLQRLAPGDTIPLTMGRQVPLMVGETILAHGTVGTAGDRMAIRLAPASFSASVEGILP